LVDSGCKPTSENKINSPNQFNDSQDKAGRNL